MEFLRKASVFVFGALSVFFAVVALLRHFSPQPALPFKYPVKVFDWSCTFPTTAKDAGKPVFILLTPETRMFNSPEAVKILNERFTVALMRTKAYPADFNLLKKLYASTGARGVPKAAILTPDLLPIILSSGFSAADSSTSPSLESALKLSLKLFKNDAQSVYTAARSISQRLSSQTPKAMFSHSLFLDESSIMRSTCSVSEIAALMANGSIQHECPAILSENARLMLAIFTQNPRIDNRALVLESAYEILRRLKGENANNPLYLRALAASAMVLKDHNFAEVCESVADEFIDRESEDGFYLANRRFSIAENALLSSALCHVYKATGKKRFLDKAKDIANSIVKNMHSNAPRALPFEESEASLETVAYSARACADLYLLCREDIYKNNTYALLAIAERDFFKNGAFRTNSAHSNFAFLARPRANCDADMPSAEGVIAQIRSDIANVRMSGKNDNTFKKNPRVYRTALENLSIAPFENLDKASIRLALLPNPLMR